MTLRQYNPADVSIIFNGTPITGFADGTFLNVERNEDAFTLQMGTDGEGTRSKSNNKSGRFTFTLMQSSATNDLLSAILALDELSGDGVGPVMIKDLNGTSLYTAESAWIVKYPAAEHGREATGREWIIETDNLSVFEGSN